MYGTLHTDGHILNGQIADAAIHASKYIATDRIVFEIIICIIVQAIVTQILQYMSLYLSVYYLRLIIAIRILYEQCAVQMSCIVKILDRYRIFLLVSKQTGDRIRLIKIPGICTPDPEVPVAAAVGEVFTPLLGILQRIEELCIHNTLTVGVLRTIECISDRTVTVGRSLVRYRLHVVTGLVASALLRYFQSRFHFIKAGLFVLSLTRQDRTVQTIH